MDLQGENAGQQLPVDGTVGTEPRGHRGVTEGSPNRGSHTSPTQSTHTTHTLTTLFPYTTLFRSAPPPLSPFSPPVQIRRGERAQSPGPAPTPAPSPEPRSPARPPRQALPHTPSAPSRSPHPSAVSSTQHPTLLPEPRPGSARTLHSSRAEERGGPRVRPCGVRRQSVSPTSPYFRRPLKIGRNRFCRLPEFGSVPAHSSLLL